MFRQTWKKYLPVITILMKRSSAGEQTLSMNHTDFERAAGGRKIKFNFSGLVLENGRIDYNSKHAPLAKDLVLVLQENEPTRKLLQKQLFEFAMTSEYKLVINNKTPQVSSEEITVKPENGTDKDVRKDSFGEENETLETSPEDTPNANDKE